VLDELSAEHHTVVTITGTTLARPRPDAALSHMRNPTANDVVPASQRIKGSDLQVRSGEPLPLGAHWDGQGTNFSVFSEVATRIELCLFDEAGHERRVKLPEVTAMLSLISPMRNSGSLASARRFVVATA